MAQYLVRHAKAGSRNGWVGPDEARPLTRAGREQAEAIMRALGERPVPRTLSSPYRRCVETLQPLATKLGLSVEVVTVLGEGESAAEPRRCATAQFWSRGHVKLILRERGGTGREQTVIGPPTRACVRR